VRAEQEKIEILELFCNSRSWEGKAREELSSNSKRASTSEEDPVPIREDKYTLNGIESFVAKTRQGTSEVMIVLRAIEIAAATSRRVFFEAMEFCSHPIFAF
jgi:hypothetical protein